MDIGKNLVQIIENRMIQNLRRNVELEIISQEILFIISFLNLKKKKKNFPCLTLIILFSVFFFLRKYIDTVQF